MPAAPSPRLRLPLALVMGVALGWTAQPAPARPVPARPTLATDAQLDAERKIVALLADPRIRAVQAQLRAELATYPMARQADGAATLDRAIGQWTTSLAFKVYASDAAPTIMWSTDDTPHRWFGHTIAGSGTSGDNPDNIYRLATLDGGVAYEITGMVDRARAPAQFTAELVYGDPAAPPGGGDKAHAGLPAQIAIITERDLTLAPDGRFRITVGGPADGAGTHVDTRPGKITLAFRDTLSDWTQRANRLSIRRLDGEPTPRPEEAALIREVAARLPAYARFWAHFPENWLGGLKPNALGGPIARDGGWGFVAGLRFHLADDEALLFTTTGGQARYTGVQLVDPWMISPDVRAHRVSLNLSQARADAEGRYTYVIAARDPGVANWIDTAGLRDGYAVLRLQGTPTTTGKDALVRDVRVVKRADIAALVTGDVTGAGAVTPAARAADRAKRAADYDTRVR